MPYPLQTTDHPLSPSAELWDSILEGFRKDRPQFVADSLPGVFAIGAGNNLSTKVLEHFERIVAEADGIAIEKTVALFNQATENELRALVATGREIPIMILHGDADQGMPLEASAVLVKDIVPWVDLKVYTNAGHGTHERTRKGHETKC
jgi:non-heme chloroperoxidase